MSIDWCRSWPLARKNRQKSLIVVSGLKIDGCMHPLPKIDGCSCTRRTRTNKGPDPLYDKIVHLHCCFFHISDGYLSLLATGLLFFWVNLSFWTCWSRWTTCWKCLCWKCFHRLKWKYHKYPSHNCQTRYRAKYKRKTMAIQLLQVLNLIST